MRAEPLKPEATHRKVLLYTTELERSSSRVKDKEIILVLVLCFVTLGSGFREE